jgi:hypothetical protein
MKLSGDELEEKAGKALRSCLAKVPFLRIEDMEKEPYQRGMQPDFLVKLALPNGEQVLVVEVKNNGQPRLARQAVNQLLRYREILSGAYGVFMAPYISPKAAEVCVNEGLGYADLSGNCYLCFGQVYIEQEGKPNLFAKKRDLRSLYSPKAERVLRVLLSNPKKTWKIKALADEAQVSIGQVSNVNKLLNDREWILKKQEGFVISAPEQLLSEWSENYTFRRNKIRNFYSLKSVSEIEADLADICNKKGLNYALTGFSGAARLAPAVRYKRGFAYLDGSDEDIPMLLGLKEVPSGANVTLLIPYDEGVLYGTREFAGIRIASPVQIYLDLIGFRGRGEEAADAILAQVIRPQW